MSQEWFDCHYHHTNCHYLLWFSIAKVLLQTQITTHNAILRVREILAIQESINNNFTSSCYISFRKIHSENGLDSRLMLQNLYHTPL